MSQKFYTRKDTPRLRSCLLVGVLLLIVGVFCLTPSKLLVAQEGSASSEPALQSLRRPFPNTNNGIYVFSDQFNTANMTEAQFKFAATHYVGAQKLLPQAILQLRKYNPNFIVLHYRLGEGLGYRTANSQCQPTGNYIQIIDHTWTQEWPGDNKVQPQWFFQYDGQPRVYNCSLGWYLMNINNPSWRQWWSQKVIEQLEKNRDDGVFADSYSIPNYFTNWKPNLSAYDPTFEEMWARSMHNFTNYMRARFRGRWYWIPNIGSYITTRDPSDYTNVDGAMIEDFAEWGNLNFFALSDWQLQMNRVLSLVKLNKIIIAQSYPKPWFPTEQMFDIASYLLIKGSHTYVNLDMWGLTVQWTPQYDINLGPPVDPLPSNISSYWYPNWKVYVRHYQNGMVLVNPTTADTGTIALNNTYYKVNVAQGGGPVPADGSAPGSLSYTATSTVDLAPHTAVVLLDHQP